MTDKSEIKLGIPGVCRRKLAFVSVINGNPGPLEPRRLLLNPSYGVRRLLIFNALLKTGECIDEGCEGSDADNNKHRGPRIPGYAGTRVCRAVICQL